MSDIRFEGWLHRTGTGGVYQDSAGNVGIASTQPKTSLDIGNGAFQVGPAGIATVTTVKSTNIVNATPLTNRNLIINGAMRVAQRGDTASVTSGYGGADRFKFDRDGATAVTLKQGGASDSPVSEGFSNCQHIDITSADTSMGSANYNILTTRLEGYNLQGIQKGTANARELTLSFYIKSTVTGTYIAELVDQTNSARHVNKAYTVSASNTWEKKEITFPADTTGTITSDHNRRLDINWWLGAGSTYNSGTLQTSWGSDTNANRAVGQVNAVNSASNDIMITGVQLEVGSVATPFEHRPYGEDERQCHRYYYLAHEMNGLGGEKPINLGVGENGSTICSIIRFPITMRTVPTMETASGSNLFMFREDNNSHSFTSLSLRYATRMAAEFTQSGSVSLTSAVGGMLRGAGDAATVAFQAEL